MTYRELLEHSLEHTLGQRCTPCYDDYLYDTGNECQTYKKIQAQLHNNTARNMEDELGRDASNLQI